VDLVLLPNVVMLPLAGPPVVTLNFTNPDSPLGKILFRTDKVAAPDAAKRQSACQFPPAKEQADWVKEVPLLQ
jgi:hypothetical protein